MIEEFIKELLGEVELTEEDQIMRLADTVRKEFPDSKCTYFYAGGYNSPGYDIDCYVVTYLEYECIQGYSLEIESY